MNLQSPFRGSAAVAAGLLTRDRLYGPRFQRLFPDVYAPAAAEPNLLLRSRAAAIHVGGRGVLVGYSAAEAARQVVRAGGRTRRGDRARRGAAARPDWWCTASVRRSTR